MTKILLLYAFLALLIPQVNAADVKMGIVTGSTKGTYYQIGKNIRSLVSRHGINLTVYPAKGSLDNIADVYKRKGVQLGIAQSDVLSYIDSLSTKDRRMKRIAKKIKMVFPLYNEEVHLLAKTEINSLFDLDGKIVAVGKEGSGSYLTANLLFQLAEITPAKRVEIGGTKALEALRRSEIDAMFYVAGYPVKLFQQAVTGGKWDLVPITEKSITEFYPTSTIPKLTYSWQSKTVPTVAVKAVLITFDYKGNNCGRVGRLAKIMYDNLDWLKRHGHSKWNNVDFDFDLRKWDQYGCVKKWITPESEESQEPGRINDTLMDALRKQFD